MSDNIRVTILKYIEDEMKISLKKFHRKNINDWKIYHCVWFICYTLNMPLKYVDILYMYQINGKELIKLNKNNLIYIGFECKHATIIDRYIYNIKCKILPKFNILCLKINEKTSFFDDNVILYSKILSKQKWYFKQNSYDIKNKSKQLNYIERISRQITINNIIFDAH